MIAADATLADFMVRICADPDSDAERLILADWLEEQGRTEQAEFVRVQVELAALEADKVENYRPRWAELCQRERLLLRGNRFGVANNETLWPEETFGHGFIHQTPGHQHILTNWVFRRGFVEAVTLSAEDWLRHADALTAAAPIREVTLTTWPKLIEREGADGRSWWSLSFDGAEVQSGDSQDATRQLFAVLWFRIHFAFPD